MAFGQLRLSPSAFDEHTPETLAAAIEGFKELEIERNRREWERTRFLAFYIRNLWLKKPLKSPSNWFEFDWEKPEPTEKTPEQIEAEKAQNKRINDRFDLIAKQMFK